MTPSSLTAIKATDSQSCSVRETHDSPKHDGFALLVERHSGMVLGACRRILGNADAEDAAQAVFVLFWQKAMHLRQESQIVAWLHRAAQYVSLNARNSRNKRSQHERKAAAGTATMSTPAAESAQWSEFTCILDEELNRIPEKQRIVFVLFHLQNRSLAEVADLVGSTIPTVGTQLQRSRQNLADRLKKRGVVIGATAITSILSQLSSAEAIPPDFVATTVETASAVSTVGLTACAPAVAALVKGGAIGGLSKTFWILITLATFAVSFPLLMIWMLPVLQTRHSADYSRLQGDWQEVKSESNNANRPESTPVEFVTTLEFSGRQFRRFQTMKDGRVLNGERGTFLLDNSQNPSAINFHDQRGTIYGVYDLEKDSLTVCITEGGGPRPDGFSTTIGDQRILTRYERIK